MPSTLGPNGWIVDEIPTTLRWSDSTGTALVRPDGTLAPASIRVFSWAELQAAYPNGGAALAALPTGVRAFISDFNHEWVPSADKTFWMPAGGRAPLYRRATLFSSYISRLTGNGAAQYFTLPEVTKIPAGMLQPGARLFVSGRMRRTAWAATGAASCFVKLGTAGTDADSTISQQNIAGALNAYWEIFDAPTVLNSTTMGRATFQGRMTNNVFASGNLGAVTTNINIAADMYVTFSIASTFVASDQVDLHEYAIWMEY